MKVTQEMLIAALDASYGSSYGVGDGNAGVGRPPLVGRMQKALEAAFALIPPIELPREQTESTPGGDYYNYSADEVKQAITDAGYRWEES